MDSDQTHSRISKAFKPDQGQYVIHLYVKLTQGWLKFNSVESSDSKDEHNLHITLIRGHRAIYYHQIKPLVSALKVQCSQLQPLSLCLDELRVFNNHERTSQFLCLAARASNKSKSLDEFKLKLINIVDQFAERLTQENETNDTIAHCSFMFRNGLVEEPYLLNYLQKLCLEKLDELPICIVRIDKFELRVGKQVYEFDLLG